VGKLPWNPGVQLFSMILLGGGGHQSGTIGTVVVDSDVTRITPQPAEGARVAARLSPGHDR